MGHSISTNRGGVPSTSENVDLDDTVAEAKSLIQKIKDVGKKRATRQLIFGLASGWLTGFVMIKLGKATAFTVGSGILALQLANSSGYIKMNWNKLTRDMERVAEQIEDSTVNRKKGLLKKVRNIVETNTCMAAGFMCGFFLVIF